MTCPTRPDERLSPRVGHRIPLSKPPVTVGIAVTPARSSPCAPPPSPVPAARTSRSPVLARSAPPPARPLSGRGQTRTMSEQANQQAEPSNIVVVGPDGMAIEGGEGDHGERPVTDMVEQPAKVMRIGSMIRQLLDEVKAAPLDEKSRARLSDIHRTLDHRAGGRPGPGAGRGAGAALPAVQRGRRRRATPSCGSRRPSWSAGWKGSSTASRRRCSRSRWPPGRSSNRCAARCRPV